MKSFIIFVHSKSASSFMPKLSLQFSISTSSALSQAPYHSLAFESSRIWKLSLISLYSRKLKVSHFSFQFRNLNPKPQDGVKIRLLARLGVMGVQENPGKTKWSSGGESWYPKIKTLTSKCVLDSQILLQDSFISKK